MNCIEVVTMAEWFLIGLVVALLLLAFLVAAFVLVIRFGWYAQALLVIALVTTAISSKCRSTSRKTS